MYTYPVTQAKAKRHVGNIDHYGWLAQELRTFQLEDTGFRIFEGGGERCIKGFEVLRICVIGISGRAVKALRASLRLLKLRKPADGSDLWLLRHIHGSTSDCS